MANYFPTDDIHLNCSRGLVKDTEVVNIFGYNSSVALDFIPLWENTSTYTYPTSNLTMTAVSANTADVGIVYLIQGLDSNYNKVQTTFTINGTTPVTIDKPFFRINNVVAISGNEVGTITIANNGVTYAAISNGTGKNQASIYTVPAGYEFFMYRIDAFSATALSNKYLVFRNSARNVPANTVLRVAQTTFINNMNIMRRFPFRYAEKTDIQYQAKSSSQTNEVGIFVEGILIKKPIGP
jgi:hypothetical protein